MARFGRNSQPTPLTPRQQLEAKYSVARTSLLLIVILTVVNMTLLLLGEDGYFLFSATVPYLLVEFGMLLCGKLPPEIYEQSGIDYATTTFFPPTLLTVLAILAYLFTLVYLVLWFFARKHKGCLMAALVLFAVDTLLLLVMITPAVSGLLDLLFHGLFIYELIVGLRAKRTADALPQGDVYDVPCTDTTGTWGASAEASEPTLFETAASDSEPFDAATEAETNTAEAEAPTNTENTAEGTATDATETEAAAAESTAADAPHTDIPPDSEA